MNESIKPRRVDQKIPQNIQFVQFFSTNFEFFLLINKKTSKFVFLKSIVAKNFPMDGKCSCKYQTLLKLIRCHYLIVSKINCLVYFCLPQLLSTSEMFRSHCMYYWVIILYYKLHTFEVVLCSQMFYLFRCLRKEKFACKILGIDLRLIFGKQWLLSFSEISLMLLCLCIIYFQLYLGNTFINTCLIKDDKRDLFNLFIFFF